MKLLTRHNPMKKLITCRLYLFLNISAEQETSDYRLVGPIPIHERW